MFINGVIKRRTRSSNLSKPFKTGMSSQPEQYVNLTSGYLTWFLVSWVRVAFIYSAHTHTHTNGTLYEVHLYK